MRIVNGLIFLSFLLSSPFYAAESQSEKIGKVYQEQWFSLSVKHCQIENLWKQLSPSSFKDELKQALTASEKFINLYRSTTYDKPFDRKIWGKYINLFQNYYENLERDIKRISFPNLTERLLAIKAYQSVSDFLVLLVISSSLNLHKQFGMLITKRTSDQRSQKLYQFIENICKANNMPIPLFFIGYNIDGKSSFAKNFLGKNILFLDKNMLDDKHPEDIIKSVIAHELGHLYYQDTKKHELASKYSSSLSSPDFFRMKYSHFKERRADLFAAQYGYGPPLASYFASDLNEFNDTNESEFIKAAREYFKNLPGSTHPSISERVNYLNTLPIIPNMNTIYQPIFRSHGLSLIATPKINQSGKIVASSAQPIRPQIQPATAATLNAQRALRALGALKKLPK